MFGLENSANNFGASAGLLANTIALRPIKAALGTLFVSTDTLLLYRYNGTGWDNISGSGSGITGAFNGLQQQGSNIGLGGVLSEATEIDISGFPITFNADATATTRFIIINDAPISEIAYFTSQNSGNDGGVYIGNFEIYGTIQSKEYAGQTPTELRLNKAGGNVSIGSTASFNVDNTAFKFTFSNANVLIGSNIDNGKKLQVEGQITAALSSVLNPAFSFGNDTDTGMYRSSAGTIGMTCQGVRQLTISANGLRCSTQLIDTSTSGTFKVGLYTAGVIASTGSVKLEINGVVYRLLTST